MDFHSILWDADDDPLGNVQHIADHDLSIEDVEFALGEPVSDGTSRSSGLPATWGYSPDGRYLIVIYQRIDHDTIRVVTAYEVPEP
jgi:uncharacterized DUF497 family protein